MHYCFFIHRYKGRKRTRVQIRILTDEDKAIQTFRKALAMMPIPSTPAKRCLPEN